MTADERQAAVAQVIKSHLRRIRRSGVAGPASTPPCSCGLLWTPLHVARMLDEAGLLCALSEVPS